MSLSITIVVETTDGEPVNVKTCRVALEQVGYKLRARAPGNHIIARSVIAKARENLVLALDIADPEGADREVTDVVHIQYVRELLASWRSIPPEHAEALLRQYDRCQPPGDADFAICRACNAEGPYNGEHDCPYCGGQLRAFDPQAEDVPDGAPRWRSKSDAEEIARVHPRGRSR